MRPNALRIPTSGAATASSRGGRHVRPPTRKAALLEKSPKISNWATYLLLQTVKLGDDEEEVVGVVVAGRHCGRAGESW